MSPNLTILKYVELNIKDKMISLSVVVLVLKCCLHMNENITIKIYHFSSLLKVYIPVFNKTMIGSEKIKQACDRG